MKWRLSRFWNYLRAFVGGYYWAHCRWCGRGYGGHENTGTVMTSWSGGYTVCPNCAEKAEAYNKEYMKNNPPPSVYMIGGQIVTEEEFKRRQVI